jgi:cytidylate kinase
MADDAVRIDTTDLGVEAMIDALAEQVRRRTKEDG